MKVATSDAAPTHQANWLGPCLGLGSEIPGAEAHTEPTRFPGKIHRAQPCSSARTLEVYFKGFGGGGAGGGRGGGILGWRSDCHWTYMYMYM